MYAGPSVEPQRRSTCGMCPTFHSSTCMCVRVWVCDINTSEGYFHRVFSGGALTGISWKWQCESWGEQERGVLLNLKRAKPEVALISPRNATRCWQRRRRRHLTSANWQLQPYRLNNALSHTFCWVFILPWTTEQIKTLFYPILPSDRKKPLQIEKKTKITPEMIKKATVKLKFIQFSSSKS